MTRSRVYILIVRRELLTATARRDFDAFAHMFAEQFKLPPKSNWYLEGTTAVLFEQT